MNRNYESPEGDANIVEKALTRLLRVISTGRAKSLRGGVLLPVVIASLAGLCLPAIFEYSVFTQVGVDARNANNAKSSGKRTKSKARTKFPKPQAQATMGTLVIKTDMECRVRIGTLNFGELTENGEKILPIEIGEYLVQGQSVDGLYNWSKIVQLSESQRVTVLIELKREKAAAEEAARAEEKRKADAEEAARREEEERREKAAAEATPKPEANKLSDQPGMVNDLLKKGDELFKVGNLAGAIKTYEQALTLDANNDQAVSYIAYSYNRLHNSEQARWWMNRRVEIPGQSPSKKAQAFTDITLLYWDEAHIHIATCFASGGRSVKAEDLRDAKKLLNEGIESGIRAVAIAPRSAKAFNLLNLLYRDSAAIEVDVDVRETLIAKADDALRKSIQFFEGIPQQQSNDLWVVPTLSVIIGSELGKSRGFGAATKTRPLDMKVGGEVIERVVGGASPVVEVIVGRDGRVRLPRILKGQEGAVDEVALDAARQWEFQPTAFEGHRVQVIEVISSAEALAKAGTGQITIKATNLNGVPVPGAIVTVKSVDTRTKLLPTMTNAEGIVTVRNLKPGLYEVTVEGGSFAPFKQKALVTAEAKLLIEVTLMLKAMRQL